MVVDLGVAMYRRPLTRQIYSPTDVFPPETLLRIPTRHAPPLHRSRPTRGPRKAATRGQRGTRPRGLAATAAAWLAPLLPMGRVRPTPGGSASRCRCCRPGELHGQISICTLGPNFLLPACRDQTYPTSASFVMEKNWMPFIYKVSFVCVSHRSFQHFIMCDASISCAMNHVQAIGSIITHVTCAGLGGCGASVGDLFGAASYCL